MDLNTCFKCKIAQERLEEDYKNDRFVYLESREFEEVYKYIAEVINKYSIKSVLDVGCGVAVLKKHLDDKIEYAGIDASKTAIRRAKNGNCGGKYYCRRLDNPIDFIQWFDCILFCNFLYLIKEDKLVEFVKFFTVKCHAEYFITVDCCNTDLRNIRNMFKEVESKKFFINMNLPEYKKYREVIIYKI